MIKLLGVASKNNTIKELEKVTELQKQLSLILKAHI